MFDVRLPLEHRLKKLVFNRWLLVLYVRRHRIITSLISRNKKKTNIERMTIASIKSPDNSFASICSFLYYLVDLVNKMCNKSYWRLIDVHRSHIFFIRKWREFIEHDHWLKVNAIFFLSFLLEMTCLLVLWFVYSLVSLISMNGYAYQWEKNWLNTWVENDKTASYCLYNDEFRQVNRVVWLYTYVYLSEKKSNIHWFIFDIGNGIFLVWSMNRNQVLLISVLIFNISCHCWHQTLTFDRQLSYDMNTETSNPIISSEMKFFMWYNSYAIYGAREKLILLRPVFNTSSVSWWHDFFHEHRNYLDRNLFI